MSEAQTMLRRYRALGADLPFTDPRRTHEVAMEGYFWRFSDARSGRVVIALCGLCQSPRGPWANLALGGHPGGFQRELDVAPAHGTPGGFGVRAGDAPAPAFDAGETHLRVDLGPDARLEVELTHHAGWGRSMLGGAGAAHLLPGLSQYWHPHLLGAEVRGHAVLGSQRICLDGFSAYAEKNWSPLHGGFPSRWWWGQAQGFAHADVTVAFAGGEVVIGPATLEATGLVVRVGGQIIRLGNPLLGPVRVDAEGEHWSVRGRGPRHGVELEGGGPLTQAHALPIPLLAERRSVPGALEHLAVPVRLVVRRRGRVLFAGESPVGGLELGGAPAAGAELARRAGRL